MLFILPNQNICQDSFYPNYFDDVNVYKKLKQKTKSFAKVQKNKTAYNNQVFVGLGKPTMKTLGKIKETKRKILTRVGIFLWIMGNRNVNKKRISNLVVGKKK